MRFLSIGALCLLALCSLVAGITVTPFTACGRCSVSGLWYSDNGATFLLSGSTLYFSPDEGTTWSQKLTNVAQFYQSQANSSYAVADVANVVYVTKDGGKTFTAVQPATQIYVVLIELHPHNPATFLVTSTNRIWETNDFGQTWTTWNFFTPYVQWSMDINSPTTAFAMNSSGVFGYTTDGKALQPIFTSGVVDFLVTNHHVWVVTYAGGNEVDLYISSRNNDPAHTNSTWYLEAMFPFGDEFLENGYTILEDVSSQGFLGLNSLSNTRGNIFTSEYEGSSWTLSLRYAAKTSAYFDFDVVSGIRGLAIANNVSDYQEKTTVITFDNGGEWRYLSPPATDSQGNPFPCTDEICQLHIHGLSSYLTGPIPPFYSSSNAIGHVVAIGNVGSELLDNNDQLSTFFTRDNGLTWFEIDEHVTIYEFGDHGGILVWARIDHPTNQIRYSLDEGLTIQTFNFSTTPINVQNIITELGGPGRKFLLYGEAAGTNYIYGLDFSDVQTRICEDSDYETYSPSDGMHGSQSCVLGRTVTYQRRKRESACYNDRDTDHFLSVTPCPCTFEDYECQWEWNASPRNSTDGFTCTARNPAVNDPPTYCPDYYWYQTGYYVIPDDGCQGGLQLGAYQKPCPNPTPTSSSGTPAPAPAPDNGGGGHGIAIAVAVILVVVFGAVIGVIMWKKPTVLGNVLGMCRKKESYSAVSTIADDDGDDNTV